MEIIGASVDVLIFSVNAWYELYNRSYIALEHMYSRGRRYT